VESLKKKTLNVEVNVLYPRRGEGKRLLPPKTLWSVTAHFYGKMELENIDDVPTLATD